MLFLFCSIYKVVSKAKISINDIKQIAQVCCSIFLPLHNQGTFSWIRDCSRESFWLSCFIDVPFAGHFQLRIIIKPKSCTRIGPLCSAEQVKVPSHCDFFCLIHHIYKWIMEYIYIYIWIWLVFYYLDMLPCSWPCPWHMASNTPIRELANPILRTVHIIINFLVT